MAILWTKTMVDVKVTSRQSLRSRAPLTSEHLCRLAVLADADHEFFTRPGGRSEYRLRRLAVVLAQGAALHYLHGLAGDLHRDTADLRRDRGVKDFDVWAFYAAIPGSRFPADRRDRHADFGPSVFGRQLYDLGAARSAYQRAQWQRWSAYSGRKVDFLLRALPVPAGAPISSVIKELQGWLAHGAQNTSTHKKSAWYLAQEAMVLLYPDSCRGDVVWPPGWLRQH
jgi:hypothetical protein